MVDSLVESFVELHTTFVESLMKADVLVDTFGKPHSMEPDTLSRYLKIAQDAKTVFTSGSIVSSADILSLKHSLDAVFFALKLEIPVACVSWRSPVCWWAGKLLKGSILADHAGRNEKTRLTVWLREKDAGPPPRGVDSETHKNILEYYHKRQQELNRLEEDDDDSYLNSVWTDPRELKNTLTCGNDIKFKFYALFCSNYLYT